jgi:holo-[acyl-carrier protein] synthase
MILGTGIDLMEVERIERTLSLFGERFLKRVFTPAEIEYCRRHRNSAERYAARFAAKEAGMKALGTGWSHGIRWRDLEVVRRPGGRPTLEFRGVAAERAAGLRVRNVALSLTHTSTEAIAQVILED